MHVAHDNGTLDGALLDGGLRQGPLRGAALLSWKSRLAARVGRQIHALMVEQQERHFLATAHGRHYHGPAPLSAETAAVLEEVVVARSAR